MLMFPFRPSLHLAPPMISFRKELLIIAIKKELSTIKEAVKPTNGCSQHRSSVNQIKNIIMKNHRGCPQLKILIRVFILGKIYMLQ